VNWSRAIEEPARRGHWAFEPGLVDLILRDIGDEPGALPLLSHAQRQRELESAQKLAETEKQAAGRLRIRNRVITAGGGDAVNRALEQSAKAIVIVAHAILRVEIGSITPGV
jgi:hypothetical protein